MISDSESSRDNAVAQFASTPPIAGLPPWYSEMLDSVSVLVSQGQQRVVHAANQELVRTYWYIGQEILVRQTEQGWGTKVIDRLSADLRDSHPCIKGFSPRNLKYMRSFAEAWSSTAIVQDPLAQLPWYHQIALLEKLNDEPTRIWYARHAISDGWSRNVLVHQIETRLHQRLGQAVSNFQRTLPLLSSDLAQNATKDPYVFDFLTMSDAYGERELESQLLQHVERFMLELGRGFAFGGRQLRLDVAGDEFFPDLVFYNFILRRLVVIELKAT